MPYRCDHDKALYKSTFTCTFYPHSHDGGALISPVVYVVGGRQALTVYEQLRLEEDGVVGRVDDIGTRVADHVGLARRVREQCRQQSEIVRLVMHRETIYQGSLSLYI